MAILSRAACERNMARIEADYPLSSRDLINGDGYLQYSDGRIGSFGRPWRQWTPEDVRAGRMSRGALIALYDAADSGYYDLVCHYMPSRYNGDALQYVRDITHATGRGLPRNFQQYEDMVAAGRREVDISANTTPAPAATTAPVEAGTTGGSMFHKQNFIPEGLDLPVIPAILQTDASAPALDRALEAIMLSLRGASARTTTPI